jgi:3-oxoacyl-[acyl-carrier protein] reductase
MEMGLAGKVVLVGGSSRGIGYAIARAFLAEGCRTALTGRDETSLMRAQSALGAEFAPDRVLACQGDLADIDVVRSVLATIRDRWGDPDCLVANVGSGRGRAGWGLHEADWQQLFEQNLSSSVRLVQEVLPGMTRDRRGSIVLVASIAGLESTPAPLPYSAAKAALVSYGKNLGRVVGPFSVRVNCVAPGNVLFAGGSWERHLSERREEVLHFIDAEVPLRRFGRAEEVADLVVFLSSERASFITGACFTIDGGQTRSM